MAHEEQDYIDGWQLYSDWIDDIRDESDLITDYDSDDTFKSNLTACQTNIERFKFIWDNDQLVRDIRKFYLRDLSENLEKSNSRKGKSISESKKMRELGNKSFKDGEYLQACTYYTQAVRFAPFPSPDRPTDDSLALALANRSAALYSLTRYRLCMVDIDLAMSFNYPEANVFKLLIRKVKCTHILSVWANDIEEIKTKLSRLTKNPSTKEFIKIEIANMFEFLEKTQPEEIEKEELDVEDETSIRILNSSKSLPMAADCVEMSHDEDKGRYLLLNKDVGFARLLVVEKPFVCNLAPSKRNQYCYHCFARLHLCGLSCKNCTQIFYCSRECLDENSQIHSKECGGFLDFQSTLGVAYLVAHIMFEIDFDPSSLPITNKKTTTNKPLEEVLKIYASEWPDLFYKGDYTSVVSLLDHADDYDYDSMMGYVITAVYLTLAFKDQFKSKFPEDEQSQLVLGSLILRHLLQLQTNLVSVLDQNLRNLAFVGSSLNGLEEKPIGIAIYPTVSLFNHSCQPNILSMFYKNKFYARAASSLTCGTEINYCYGPSVTRMSKRDRQTRLQEQYFFTCDCECCTKDIENESRALLCPKCDGPVIYNRDLTHRCLKCHAEDMVDVLGRLRKVEEYSKKLEELRITKDNNLKDLKEIEKELAKLVYWKNPLFVRIKSQLIECAQISDDHESALRYSKEELDLSDKTYGENSLESILTKLKYINLDWQRLSDRFDRSLTDQADGSALTELKDLQKFAQSTRGKLKELLNSTNLMGAEASFDQELIFLSETLANINRYIATVENMNKDELMEPSSSKEALGSSE